MVLSKRPCVVGTGCGMLNFQIVAFSCLISEKHTNLETDIFWSKVVIYACQFRLISQEALVHLVA